MSLSSSLLKKLYLRNKKSVFEIANLLHCSENKINYWIKKYSIHKRSISEAIYIKNNPKGDPFKVREPKNIEEAKLFGLGLGLYWGEGTKSNKSTIRLGNTDPKLISSFIDFLVKICGIDKDDLIFGLQVFSDTPIEIAINFWRREIGVKKSQFQKTVITLTRGVGTYKRKIQHGVLTVHYNNKKLRRIVGKILGNYGFRDELPE